MGHLIAERKHSNCSGNEGTMSFETTEGIFASELFYLGFLHFSKVLCDLILKYTSCS